MVSFPTIGQNVSKTLIKNAVPKNGFRADCKYALVKGSAGEAAYNNWSNMRNALKNAENIDKYPIVAKAKDFINNLLKK